MHKPINVIDLKTEKLLPEVHDIIELVAENDVILDTCHISKKECMILIPEARRAGCRKILINHIHLRGITDRAFDPAVDQMLEESAWTIEEVKQMVKEGAVMEHSAAMYVGRRNETKSLAEFIKEVGANSCEIASNCGGMHLLHPVETMRYLIIDLLKNGISEAEIETMTKRVPARLLNLD